MTDLGILNALDANMQPIFSLQAVLQQLITNAGAGAVLSPLQLFQQWWDDENQLNQLHAGQVRAGPPHCDDNLNANAAFFPVGQALLNGFPIDCSRPEGEQTLFNPFVPGPPGPLNIDSYRPIALVNRFDLAPNDGATCGEYRIIFAKETGFADSPAPLHRRAGDRNFLIFEGVMPNPRVNQGLVGCLPIETMWDGLSALNQAAQTTALQNFYFTGLNPNDGKPSFEPVINPNHYGAQLGGPQGNNLGCSFGQIRTNQFMTDDTENDPATVNTWTLREFKLIQDCRCTAPGNPCSIVIAPMSVKANPYGGLFDSQYALVAPGTPYQNFQLNHAAPGDFTSQVTAVGLGDFNPLMMAWNATPPLGNAFQVFNYTTALPDVYNAGESVSLVPPGSKTNDYVAPAPAIPPVPPNGALDQGFSNTLNAQLGTFNPPATNAQQIAGRARALSCAGCHQLSNPDIEGHGLGGGLIAWPSSQGFVHVSEAIINNPNGTQNYAISPALQNLFLVNRMTLLENFIANPRTNRAAHQTCPLPFPAKLIVNCPPAPSVSIFPVDALRALEPSAPPAINGFTPN